MWIVFCPKDDEIVKKLIGLEDNKDKIIDFTKLSQLMDKGLPPPTLVIQGPGDLGMYYYYKIIQENKGITFCSGDSSQCHAHSY